MSEREPQRMTAEEIRDYRAAVQRLVAQCLDRLARYPLRDGDEPCKGRAP